jgi:plasmid maintenance system killer protein
VIRSFRDLAAEDIFNSVDPKRARRACPALLGKVARRMLELLDSAGTLNALRVPPLIAWKLYEAGAQASTVFAFTINIACVLSGPKAGRIAGPRA